MIPMTLVHAAARRDPASRAVHTQRIVLGMTAAETGAVPGISTGH